MMQFFQDMSANPMLLTGLVAGLLAGPACGIVGPLVVTRRVVFLAGAIAHMAVGGVGAAIYLAYHFPDQFGWLTPLHAAVIVSLGSAILLAVVQHHVAERIDTLIGAMWAVGMSVGVLLAKLTPGYQTELMSYLFGNISIVGWRDVGTIMVLDAAILTTVLLCYKRFIALCVDEEHARLQGVNVLAMNMVLLCMVALTVVCLIQIVGLILVLAMLTLPAATAGHHLRRMAGSMVVATILCSLLMTLPRVAVYSVGLSPESAIVLAAAAVYLLSLVVVRLRRRLSA